MVCKFTWSKLLERSADDVTLTMWDSRHIQSHQAGSSFDSLSEQVNNYSVSLFRFLSKLQLTLQI